MISKIKNNKEENGISVLIDCSSGEMIIRSGNNGDRPDVCTFKIGSFIDIIATGPEQVFHFRIESNGNSGNGIGEARPKIVQDVGPINSQVDSSDIGDIKIESSPDAVSLLIESLGKGSGKTKSKIVQDTDSTNSEVDSNDIEVIKTESNIEDVLSSIATEETVKEISEAVILKKDGIRILVALIEKGILRRKDLSEIDVFVSNVPRAFKELNKFGLIFYDSNEKIIKPNFNRITVSCPWLYSKEIREIVAESKFRLGKAVQYTLYLLCKHRDGLSQDVILSSVGFSKSGFYVTKRTMVGYDLIEVVNNEEETTIFPKFSIGQVREDPVNNQEMESAEPMISVDTDEGFNREKLKSFVNMVKRGPPNVKLQTLSSQFKAGISDGKISKLLDAINEEIEIEIVNIGTGEIITFWEAEYFRSKEFKNIAFENLEIRIKNSNLEEKDVETKDVKEQEIIPVLTENLIESKDDNEITKEQERENIIKKIEGMIAIPNLGNPHKIVLTILLDNYSINNSLQMKVSDLVESANEQNLEEAQVRACFGGLQALKFIKRPSEIIELNIEI